MAERFNVPAVPGGDLPAVLRWIRGAAGTLNEFMRQVSSTGAFFVWDDGDVAVPQSTTITGAYEIVFTSPFVGNGMLIVTGVSFQGTVNVALNGTNLGTLSDADTTSEILYEVPVTGLLNGLNSFKIWDTGSNGGTLRKLEAWRNFTAVKLGGVSPADDTFLVGDGSAFVGETGSTARTSLGANLDEANTFFGNTDLTGAEAETLSDGSNADSLHIHDYVKRLAVDTSTVGNVGAGEDDLISYTLPADSLDADGEYLVVQAFGTTAANSNAKTIKLYLGSTELTSAAASTPYNQDWCFVAHIIRTGASAGKALVKLLNDESTYNTVDYKSISEDFTTSLVIKCTGEGTSNNDIVQEGLLVELAH